MEAADALIAEVVAEDVARRSQTVEDDSDGTAPRAGILEGSLAAA